MGLPEISNPLISWLGLPAGSDSKESAYNTRDLLAFNPWVGKTPWRRERLSTPVVWPGEFHGHMGSQRVTHDRVTFTFGALWFCINENKHLNENYASTRKSLIRNYFNNSLCCCSVTESCLTVTPWTVAHQASLSFTTSWSLLKLRSIE